MTFSTLFTGFGINFAIALLIVRFIYYPIKQDKNYVFTYLAFNTIIYFVMAFLTSTELSIGVGFGLFAIFSVLRYRTSTMSTREMTYLFIMIALPVMNSTLMQANEWPILIAVNLTIAAVLYLLEMGWGFRYEQSKRIRYEQIELIRPENHQALLADLSERTGLVVRRVNIGRINFLNDTAELTIYYDEPQVAGWHSHGSNDESYESVIDSHFN